MQKWAKVIEINRLKDNEALPCQMDCLSGTFRTSVGYSDLPTTLKYIKVIRSKEAEKEVVEKAFIHLPIAIIIYAIAFLFLCSAFCKGIRA